MTFFKGKKPPHIPKKIKIVKNIRDYRKLNADRFHDDFTNIIPIEEYRKVVNPADQLSLLNDTIITALDKQIPYKEKTFNRNKENSPKWFTQEILLLKQKGRCLERHWRKYSTFEAKEQLNNHLKEYRQSIRMAKSSYYTENIISAPNSSSELFRVAKFLTTPIDTSTQVDPS